MQAAADERQEALILYVLSRQAQQQRMVDRGVVGFDIRLENKLISGKLPPYLP